MFYNMMELDFNIKSEIYIKNELSDSYHKKDFIEDLPTQQEDQTCEIQTDVLDTFKPCGIFIKVEDEVSEVKKEVSNEVNIEDISNENSENDDYEDKFIDSSEDFEQLESYSTLLSDPSVSISIVEKFIYDGVIEAEYEKNGGSSDDGCSPKDTKRFLCLICKYATNRKADYRKHLFTHSRVKLLTCPHPLCDYKSNIPSHLARHSAVHTEREKLYKCTVCGLACSRKDSLKTHLLTHSDGAKLFRCPKCDFESNRNDSLKFHLLSHLDLKLFRCGECDFSSNRKSNFKRHLLTHSIMKLYKCQDCQYECNAKSNFKRHLLRHSKSMGAKSKAETPGHRDSNQEPQGLV